MTSPVPQNPSDLTVYYDGDCPLCRAEIGHYRACAGAERIAFVDVAAASSSEIVPGLDRASALARFHVRLPDGRLRSGAAGFGELWLTLPRWRWLGRFVLRPGVLPVADLAYRAFLPLRPVIQAVWRRVARART